MPNKGKKKCPYCDIPFKNLGQHLRFCKAKKIHLHAQNEERNETPLQAQATESSWQATLIQGKNTEIENLKRQIGELHNQNHRQSRNIATLKEAFSSQCRAMIEIMQELP